MAFVSALSQHPVTAHAVGEVTGSALEQLGDRPDLVAVFVTTAHAGALEDVMGAVDEILHPLVLMGCAASAVIGPHLEVERSAGVAILAGTTGPIIPLRLRTGDQSEIGPEEPTGPLLGWPRQLPFTPSAAVVLADPFSFAPGPLLHQAGAIGELPLFGCLPAPGGGPGTSRLALGRTVWSNGAVGALLGPATAVTGVVAQGARAFGRPLTVTRAEGNLVIELAGRPALERLVEQARGLRPTEVEHLQRGGLAVGEVLRQQGETVGATDVILRPVLGSDRDGGALVVSEDIALGATVQFHLRDDDTRGDLNRALSDQATDAALLFVDAERAMRSAVPGRDVSAVTAALGPVPLAGCWAAAELGPVGGRNFIHNRSAAVALLRSGPAER